MKYHRFFHYNTLAVVFFYALTSTLWAQRKPQIADRSMGSTVTISLPTMVYNCSYCKRMVGDFVAREKGVLSYAVDAKARQIKIFYAPDLTNPDYLRVAIANAGYQADTVLAEPSATKLLPVCCRAPVDEEWVKSLKAEERERAKNTKKRYYPLRRFLCCDLCDYYYKYKILKDSSLPKKAIRR